MNESDERLRLPATDNAIKRGGAPASASTPERDTGIAAGPPDKAGLVDLVWQQEPHPYLATCGRGMSILASKLLAFAVAILFVVVAGFLLKMALCNRDASCFWSSATAVALAIASFTCIYFRAYRLETAEKAWCAKRLHFIGPVDIVPFTSSDPRTRRPAWHKALFVVSLIALLALAVDLLLLAQGGIYWVGFGDLEITFVVTDAETNEPIAGARIEIPESRSSFCNDCDAAFTLTTDAQGMCKRMCKDCMCFGYSRSRPFFREKNTFGTHKPDWVLRVSAAGYQKSDPVFVHHHAWRDTIQRGDAFATMKVSIHLHRQPAR